MQQKNVFRIMCNHTVAAAAAADDDDDDDDHADDYDDDHDGDDYDDDHHHHHHQHHHKFHKQCIYEFAFYIFQRGRLLLLLEICSFHIGNQHSHALFVAFSCAEKSTYVKLA